MVESDGQSDSSEEWFDRLAEWFHPQEDEYFGCYTGYGILLFCSVPGSSEPWVDQSWMGEFNAPKKQASTPSAETITYTEEDPYNNGTNPEDYDMQD